jgi:hypothetical protein
LYIVRKSTRRSSQFNRQPTDNTTASEPVESADQGAEIVNRPDTVAEISEDVADDGLVQTVFGALGTSVITLDQVATATDADPHLPYTLLRQYIVALPAGPWRKPRPSKCNIQSAMRKLSLYIAGEFVAAPQHQRYLIVAVDYYSKWPEVGMCGSPTTAAVTDFFTGLFERFGLVEEITTDNGVQFTSTEFAHFLQAHGIRHTQSAMYNPEANAEVKRFNRVITDGLKAAIAAGHTFQASLRQLLAANCSTPHATTRVVFVR